MEDQKGGRGSTVERLGPHGPWRRHCYKYHCTLRSAYRRKGDATLPWGGRDTCPYLTCTNRFLVIHVSYCTASMPTLTRWGVFNLMKFDHYTGEELTYVCMRCLIRVYVSCVQTACRLPYTEWAKNRLQIFVLHQLNILLRNPLLRIILMASFSLLVLCMYCTLHYGICHVLCLHVHIKYNFKDSIINLLSCLLSGQTYISVFNSDCPTQPGSS